MQHQILIASYRKDFPWLRHCLRSLEKFSYGFLPPVVAVSFYDLVEALALVREAGSGAQVKQWDGPGFGRAQDAMMSGDLLCPRADYYWLLGSDCLALKPFTPADYCAPNGLPYMLYHTWDYLQLHHPAAMHWRAGTEDALGWRSHGEFMRRLPLAYPKSMLEPMRRHIADRHGVRFTTYVHDRVNRVKNFSESNVMGEWAWKMRFDAYQWICLDGYGPVEQFKLSLRDSPIIQFWSHGGLDRPHDLTKVTPRVIIEQTLGKL